MAKAFDNIALTEIDAESPVNETLMSKFWNREESLITGPVDLTFVPGSTASASYVAVRQASAYVHPGVGTVDGAQTTLRVVFEAYLSLAGNADVRMRLGSGSWVELNLTNTGSYARKELVISAADVNAAKDREAVLSIEARVNAGGGTVYVRNQWASASRFERAA